MRVSEPGLGRWSRVLVYLGLVQPPDGTKVHQIFPWWLMLVVSAVLWTGAVLSLASRSMVLGLAEMIVAAVVGWNAWNAFTLRRRT